MFFSRYNQPMHSQGQVLHQQEQAGVRKDLQGVKQNPCYSSFVVERVQ